MAKTNLQKIQYITLVSPDFFHSLQFYLFFNLILFFFILILFINSTYWLYF